MKVVELNSCNYGSTGNIMIEIANTARNFGIKVYTSCPDSRTMRKKILDNHIYIGIKSSHVIHLVLGKITGLQGLFSIIDTAIYIQKIKKISPDIIHMHNLHESYINYPMLFNYIKKNNIKVIWTLHDCWSFTGHCPHFTISHCEKWKKGCYDCPSYKQYPSSMFDNSRIMWKLKKSWFTGVKDLTIVTPSHWLADLVKLSYLKEYPIKVINNGINLDVFKPLECDFRINHRLQNKYIILGVAMGWDRKKGLDVFVELAERLSDDYKIILVGTNDEIDKNLPSSILSIHRTNNQTELAEIYSVADLFLNPTREENYPTVNMEAIACGTPVLTFRTGGSPEIPNEKTGYVVDVDDIDELEKQIVRICTEKPFSKADCLERAKFFDKNKKFCEYVKLYNV